MSHDQSKPRPCLLTTRGCALMCFMKHNNETMCPCTGYILYMLRRLYVYVGYILLHLSSSSGVSPLCSSLFALYDDANRTWFPPNHVFHVDETMRLRLYYRMRCARVCADFSSE